MFALLEVKQLPYDCLSGCHDFMTGRVVSLPCSCRSTFFISLGFSFLWGWFPLFYLLKLLIKRSDFQHITQYICVPLCEVNLMTVPCPIGDRLIVLFWRLELLPLATGFPIKDVRLLRYFTLFYFFAITEMIRNILNFWETGVFFGKPCS